MYEKKISIVIAFSFIFNSCSTDPRDAPQTNPPTASDIGGSDAQAGIISGASLAMTMTDPELIVICPECWAAEVAYDASIASYMTAIGLGLEPSPTTPINSILPVALVVKENPYENIGKMHNAGLEYAVKNIPKSWRFRCN